MIPICRLEDLPPGESIRIDTEPPIAVFHSDGELFAIDDTCTHQNASLSEGWLEGCWIECPLHEASFDLRTGMPGCLPARKPVRTHTVTVVDNTVYVHLTAGHPAAEPTTHTPAPAPAVVGHSLAENFGHGQDIGHREEAAA